MKARHLRSSTFVKIAALISLTLCIAITGLWARSFFVCDTWIALRHHTRAIYGITSYRGGICLGGQWRIFDPAEPQDRWQYQHQTGPLPQAYPTTERFLGIAGHERFGFGWEYAGHFHFVTSAGFGKAVGIIIPHPAVLAFLLLPTLISLSRWRQSSLRRYRRMNGLCTRCGYDLRACPDRCPECGHVPGMSLGKAMTSRV